MLTVKYSTLACQLLRPAGPPPSVQLFIPPVIGLANNGDFGRIVGSLDLPAPFEDESKFAPTTYSIDPKWHWSPGFFSSEYLIATAPLALNKIASKGRTFDIRCAGAVHAALYLLAWLLALPLLRELPPVRRAVLLGFALLIYSALMYVSALNSF